MILDKNQQKKLLEWLKKQAKLDKTNLRLSVLTGLGMGLLIIGQAWILATLLQSLIVDKASPADIIPYLLALFMMMVIRAMLNCFRDQINFSIGMHLRKNIRKQILDRLEYLGPAFVKQKNIGSWSTLLIEQIDDLHDFYSRYLPQMKLAMIVPLLIMSAIFPINWVAALILLITAPLIPFFMALVGMGAADVNRRNFLALSRLSGHFLDRMKNIETIRLFNQGKNQATEIHIAAENFRKKTMQVLRLAFLSSGVLEFFSSISIAIVAVYFGFSYLGTFHFGSYQLPVSLFIGFFTLILAPEFFQPLRDLGTFYHAKAQAVAAADTIYAFLYHNIPHVPPGNEGKKTLAPPLELIEATNLIILTNAGIPLIGPLTFTLRAGEKIALIGKSGEGKTSLVNALMGFLPYRGSLKINGVELNTLDIESWRAQLTWVGQNPYLPAMTIRDNILLAKPNCSPVQLANIIRKAHVDEFVMKLPNGLDTSIGEDATQLSVGQAQRIAIARSLLKTSQLVILDEPTASLDKESIHIVNEALKALATGRTVITITHHHDTLDSIDAVWQIREQQLIITKVS